MSCTRVHIVHLALWGLMLCPSIAHAAIVVDGSLSEWGISLDSEKHLVYNAGYGYAYDSQTSLEKRGQTTINGRTIIYDLQDSDDSSSSNKVSPFSAGQDYDAEALAVSVVGSDLYIAIATGQRPDNGVSNFAPGDICISKGTKVWGIEVGGGSQTLASEVVDGDQGTTYRLASNGDTKSLRQLPNQKAGSIWDGGTWRYGIVSPDNVTTQLATGGSDGGSYLGTSDYVYRFDSAFGQHAFIELRIPNYQQLFGNDLQNATIRWAPVFGNDQLDLSVVLSSGQPLGPVPEPASLLIWTVLSLAAVCVAWKRHRIGSQSS